MIEKPTQEQLMEEDGLKSVYEDLSPWRHGNNVKEVFYREGDNTFWQVVYQRQPDGEWNGLRENSYSCDQCEPYQEIVTKYRLLPKTT